MDSRKRIIHSSPSPPNGTGEGEIIIKRFKNIMDKFKTTKVGKATSVIVGLATAAWLSVGSLAVPMTTYAQTTDETIALLLAQIAKLQADLAALQAGATTGTAEKCSFTRSLTVGSQGSDVTCLQDYLRSGGYFNRASTGYFGSITRSAVAAWQAANGVSPAAGYFGPISRAKYDSLVSVVVPPASSAGVGASSASSVAVGTGGLTISAATQPLVTFAVERATRVPFTNFTLTAGSQDVTITGVNVERTGLAADGVFAGIVLLDESGSQLGIAKTFNSEHKATIGDAVTIKAGQSKTFTVAGNMNTDASGYLNSNNGLTAYLSVTGVVTSATVSGLLPISGAGHSINGNLTIGNVTNDRGSLDPNSSTGAVITKNIGTTNYTFAAVKFTPDSVEKIRVKSIRWNQSGSAGASDLANIKTYIDGAAYDTVVSSDGKYYTSTFGDGIVVDKGGNIEISVKGDIVGGSGRTIDFDIYRNTDVYMVGETNKYGITPPNGSSDPTDDSSNFSSGNPWYDASQISVSAGTITVTKATSVASQNIAENVLNQPLGGIVVEVKGEPISANNLIFHFQLSSGDGDVEDLTNITLVDENGTVAAGPADGSGADVDYGTVTFSDTVTFPVGTKTYTLKGKLGTNFANNQTVVASTTPSSDWSNVTGQTTGNTISGSSITSSVITGNTMTVKSAVVTLSVSTNPVAQTVVSGAQGFTFANYLFDATASGEDIKFGSLPLEYNTGGATATNINNCILYDGETALNTGSNVVNPTAAGSSTTFTLDSAGLVIPKGTTKTVALKCNIVAGGTGTYRWGYDSGSSPSATGVTSGQSATITENDSAGQAMALTSGGTLTVEEDSSQPNYAAVNANSSVEIGVIKFTAANEAINLRKLGLQLTNTASSSVSDLTQLTLWDGSTQVGSLVLTGSTGTSTLTSDFIVPKDGSKLMKIKADLAAVGTALAGTQGAFIAVDYIGAGNAEGVGQSSGTTINSTSGATSFAGVRMFRSTPIVAQLTVPSQTLVTQSETNVYRFSVKADPSTSNGIGLYKITVNVATSSASAVSGTTTLTNLKVFAYTDSGFSSPVTGFTNGQVVSTIAGLINGDNDAVLSSILQIPAGSTYYFKVVGDTTLTAGTGTFSGSVTTKVTTDTAHPSLATYLGNAAGVDADASADAFIWSANATTTSNANHLDWSNGHGVSGLSGLTSVTISK
ncbi:MAG: peptidoglycan-binding protein [Candidatus Paceibacter sp.]|nr:peptidoglycan-binding protein [Candidatus Paceibacter sp.]